MGNRIEILTEIASRYEELVDTPGRTGVPGSGEYGPRMPRTYTATVKEFERLLKRMRNQAKQKAYGGYSLGTLWWHLVQWHVHPRGRVQRVVAVRQKVKGGRSMVVYTPTMVVVRHPDSREERAVLALEWMSEHWGLGVEPMVPDELREGLQVAA